MPRLFFFLLMGPLIFGQTDHDMATDSSMTEEIMVKDNISLLGHQFQHGKFYDARISENWRLQTGLFNFNSDNFIVVQLPLLVKHDFTKNFRGFFGSRLELVDDTGLPTMQPVSNGGFGFGATTEFGFQYDASDKVMFEIRYSLPVIDQSIIYPSTLNFNNSGMLFFGSGFKF